MDSAVPQRNVTREPRGSALDRPSPPVAENLPTVDNRSSEVGQTLLLRSSRVCKAPDRLIQLIKTGTLNFTFVLFHFCIRTARK